MEAGTDDAVVTPMYFLASIAGMIVGSMSDPFFWLLIAFAIGIASTGSWRWLIITAAIGGIARGAIARMNESNFGMQLSDMPIWAGIATAAVLLAVGAATLGLRKLVRG